MKSNHPHLSLKLHFNLQIEMPKLKSRSEMGLLNTLQEVTKYNGELADSLSFRQATINEEDWTPNSDWAFREVQLDVTPEIRVQG